jgi:hypothetical protein
MAWLRITRACVKVTAFISASLPCFDPWIVVQPYRMCQIQPPILPIKGECHARTH